jgi:hypothetical protein
MNNKRRDQWRNGIDTGRMLISRLTPLLSSSEAKIGEIYNRANELGQSKLLNPHHNRRAKPMHGVVSYASTMEVAK